MNIPIRARSDSPITTFGVRPPMTPDHPLADLGYQVCGGARTTEPITLVFVGVRPENRKPGGGWTTGAAVIVHAACAGLSPDQPAAPPKFSFRADKDGIHLACEACGELATWPVNDILDAGEQPSRTLLEHLHEQHKDLTWT